MNSYKKILEKISYRQSRSRTFTDFLTVSYCALSMQTEEELYLKTIKNYSKEDINLFCEAFALLVLEMDNSGQGLKDCLGGYFEEFISNGRNGQFFTPEHICTLLSSLTIGDDIEDGKTVNDCACGSGRTLLAAAKQNRNLIFWGADISLDCCYMTLINLCLNNLEGVVFWMDSLSMKIYSSWCIKKNIYGICQITRNKVEEIKQPIIRALEEEKPMIKEMQLLLDFVA